jgi:hypothetical protein
MQISPNLIKFGGGALAAGVGVGAVVAADKLIGGGDVDRRKTVAGVLAGVGGVAGLGAVLARNSKAFGPLLGAGVGLAAAGVVDAVRGGGTATVLPINDRNAVLKPGDQLPDGVQARPGNVYYSGGELRFDSEVGNQGSAPLQLALHTPQGEKPSTTQVLFNADGTAHERDLLGGLQLDPRPDHQHLHFDDFVYFQLYKAGAGDRPDTSHEIAGGVKQSFYITDVQKYDVKNQANLDAANKLKEHGRVDDSAVKADTVQGISVGMADVYGAGLAGQSFNLPNLAPGRYVLRQSFDPNDEVIEQDEHNNTTDTVIDVKADKSVKVVSSSFAPESAYTTLADGRSVIPSVVDSLAAQPEDRHADG